MNRVEIKNKAKEMIKGNKWYIWKPLIIIGLCIALVEIIAYGLDAAFGLLKTNVVEIADGVRFTYTSGGIISSIVGIFTGFASSALNVAYAMYILSFIRGKRLELSDVVDFMKKHWIVAVLTSILVALAIVAGTILLVIPGIIVALGLTFYQEVCADNPEMKPTEIFKKSWAMTKGHKAEIFVMGLSFIGWGILVGFTFGLLMIWLMPYVTVSFALAYEELKKTA